MLAWCKQEVGPQRMCLALCYLASPLGSFPVSAHVPRLFLYEKEPGYEATCNLIKFYSFLNPLRIMALNCQDLRSHSLCSKHHSI